MYALFLSGVLLLVVVGCCWVVGCWLLGCWVVGCWLLVIGCWRRKVFVFVGTRHVLLNRFLSFSYVSFLFSVLSVLFFTLSRSYPPFCSGLGGENLVFRDADGPMCDWKGAWGPTLAECINEFRPANRDRVM